MLNAQVGADDDGYAVRLKLKHFLGYLDDPVHQQDDSPMYIFDGTFGDRETSKDMSQDYSIPSWFKEDLMQLAGERRRPPYRLCKRQCCFAVTHFTWEHQHADADTLPQHQLSTQLVVKPTLHLRLLSECSG